MSYQYAKLVERSHHVKAWILSAPLFGLWVPCYPAGVSGNRRGEVPHHAGSQRRLGVAEEVEKFGELRRSARLENKVVHH